jgi:hypothetical protein
LGFVPLPNLLTSHFCAISETQQNGRFSDQGSAELNRIGFSGILGIKGNYKNCRKIERKFKMQQWASGYCSE